MATARAFQDSVGGAYVALVIVLGAVTPNTAIDGAIGPMLGRYICSLPGRNTIDVLFADRFAAARIWPSRSGRAG